LTLHGPGLLLLASLRQPLFMTRLFLWSATPMAVLAGAAFAAGRNPFVRIGLLTVFVGLGAQSLHRNYYEPFTKARWREALLELSTKSDPHAVVLAIGGRESRVLGYYTRRKTDPIPLRYVANKPEVTLEKLDSLTRDMRTVWTIAGRQHESAGRIRAALNQSFRRQWHKNYGRELVLERYSRRRR
jgi:hypothetical protein